MGIGSNYISTVLTTAGHLGLGTDSLVPTGDALFSPTVGWYNSLDMRRIKAGEVADGLLGVGLSANTKVEFGLAGSFGATTGFKDSSFSEVTWFSLNTSIGVGSPNESLNIGASYTYPWHIFHFQNK